MMTHLGHRAAPPSGAVAPGPGRGGLRSGEAAMPDRSGPAAPGPTRRLALLLLHATGLPARVDPEVELTPSGSARAEDRADRGLVGPGLPVLPEATEAPGLADLALVADRRFEEIGLVPALFPGLAPGGDLPPRGAADPRGDGPLSRIAARGKAGFRPPVGISGAVAYQKSACRTSRESRLRAGSLSGIWPPSWRHSGRD
jgi:hypothetical protein